MRRLGIVLALAAGCQAGATIDSQSAAIRGGLPDIQFVGACAVEAKLPPNPGDDLRDPLYCSCTVIAPDVVLTAAHCVFEAVDEDTTDVVRVFFGRNIDFAVDPSIGIDEFVLHRYYDDEQAGGYDIALLRLSEPVPAESVPVALNEEALTQDDVGTALTLVGYGETADGSEDFGERQKVEVTIREIKDRHLIGGSNTTTSCIGDGGGPGFADVGNGLVQVSLNARTFGCMASTIRVRVDPFVDDFIYAYLDKSSGPCALDGECVEAGCRTADPDCDASHCAWDDMCAEDCPTRDWDCELGSFAGDECSGDGACEEGGRCVPAHDDETFTYCTRPCTVDSSEPCPDGMLCTDDECRFDESGPSPGSQGFSCDNGQACRSGICEDRICVVECEVGGTACPAPYVCGPSQESPGTNVCLGEELSGGGGFCAPSSVGGRRGGTAGASLLLALLALVLAARRRRR